MQSCLPPSSKAQMVQKIICGSRFISRPGTPPLGLGFLPSAPKRPARTDATQRDGALGEKEQGDRKGDAERNSVPCPPKLGGEVDAFASGQDQTLGFWSGRIRSSGIKIWGLFGNKEPIQGSRKQQRPL